MHEMGITQSILDTAIEAAEDRGATRITKISVQVGVLTEIVEYALQFAFEALTPGTLAEGAELTVEMISPRSRCGQCGTEFDHGRFDSQCPECGNPFNEPLSGRELLISSIDIDTPEGRADLCDDESDADANTAQDQRQAATAAEE